ncbi:MAG: PAQR family membrane homeostasis protein TrhA [Planctomycetota bacterium]
MREQIILRKHRRKQSFGEEIANSVSHGLGLLGTIAVSPVLIAGAVEREDVAAVIGNSVFCVTMAFVYLSSTLYHALPLGRAKRMVRRCDHAAIYLLIAGTYTPFTLGVLRGPWGWTLFGIVWTLALLGLFVESRVTPETLATPISGPARTSERREPPAPAHRPRRGSRRVSIAIYLGMGWIALIAVGPIRHAVSNAGLFWILAGGLSYMVGLVFYAASGVRYAHLAWHLCVLSGSTCFFLAVLWYSF